MAQGKIPSDFMSGRAVNASIFTGNTRIPLTNHVRVC